MKTDLAAVRDKIDALDDRILQLLNERAVLARKAGANKQGATKFGPSREASIIRRLTNHNTGPLPNDTVKAVFREIISGCLRLERPLYASYLGPAGSFSEDAARQRLGAGAELVPRANFEEVVGTVESGDADIAVLPIENSTDGSVGRSLDLLLKTPLSICDEVLLPIHHQLLSSSASLKQITEVIAHPQALAQCRQWLALNLPHAKQTTVSSNSEAARLASKHKARAAIAPAAAASLYDVPILTHNIEDNPDNATRFLLLGSAATTPTGADKTSLVCAAANAPGSLLKLLEAFSAHEVSMLRLESRPALSGTWEYVFYIDIEGHQQDSNVAKALALLKRRAALVKILGSYPKAV